MAPISAARGSRTPQSSKFRRSKRLPSQPLLDSPMLRQSQSETRLNRGKAREERSAEQEESDDFMGTMRRLDKDFKATSLPPNPGSSVSLQRGEGLLYMHVMRDANQAGINIYVDTNLESRILYFVEKGCVLTCSEKRQVLGVPWYKTVSPVAGWACGELPTDRAHIILADQEETMVLQYPTLMRVDELYAGKRFELENLERRTLSAQVSSYCAFSARFLYGTWRQRHEQLLICSSLSRRRSSGF